jgi:hypothetical protein
VRSGAGGVLAVLLQSSFGLQRWWEVVGGCVLAAGKGRWGVWCVKRGVFSGAGVVLVDGRGVCSAWVGWSIVVVVCWDIWVGGGSMCGMWGGKCDGSGGILVVLGVSGGRFLLLSEFPTQFASGSYPAIFYFRGLGLVFSDSLLSSCLLCPKLVILAYLLHGKLPICSNILL